jgi:hypothetical protein
MGHGNFVELPFPEGLAILYRDLPQGTEEITLTDPIAMQEAPTTVR